jgi:hypothetical protein
MRSRIVVAVAATSAANCLPRDRHGQGALAARAQGVQDGLADSLAKCMEGVPSCPGANALLLATTTLDFCSVPQGARARSEHLRRPTPTLIPHSTTKNLRLEINLHAGRLACLYFRGDLLDCTNQARNAH